MNFLTLSIFWKYIPPSYQSNQKLRLAFFLLAVSWSQCLTKCLFYLQSCVNFSPESHAAEKRQLVNEIVSLKKMSDLRERESARRDVQVHQYKSEADKGLTALQEAERKVQNYRIEVGRRFTISMAVSINPLHPNISLHLLHTVLRTFPKVLTGRICVTIMSFFSW